MKKVLFAIMAIVLCVGLMGSAFAYFTDSATSANNSFTAGTLSIHATDTFSTPFVLPNMAPGDVTGPYTIIIRNTGSINEAWFGDWQFTGGTGNGVDLKDVLYIASAQMEFLSPSLAPWDTTDPFITNGVGSGLYPAWFNTLVNSYGVISFNTWNNNADMIPNSVYEHVGALKPGYEYKLTVSFGMASTATNAYQGLGPVTAKLKIDATQINTAAVQAVTGGWGSDLIWLNQQIAKQTMP
jgi:predicted ribosomally synthesized peptide with SipW-like signal peptide